MDITANDICFYSIVTFFAVLLLSYIIAKKDVANPAVITPVFFTIYWVSPNIGDRTYAINSLGEISYFIFGAVVLISYYLGSFLASLFKFKSQGNNNEQHNISLEQGAWISTFIIMPFFLLIIGKLLKTGLGNSSYADMRDVIIESTIFGNPIVTVIVSGIVAFYASGKKYALLMPALAIVLSLLTGERGFVVTSLFPLLIVYHYKHQRITRNKFFLTLAILITVAGLYGTVRSALSLGLVNFLNIFFTRILSNPYLFVNPFDTGEFFNVSVPAKLLIADGNHNFNYGTTFLQGLLRVLPIVGRFVDFAPDVKLFIKEYYSERLFAQGAIGGVGAIMFGVEGFISYGLRGTTLQAFTWGFVTGLFYHWASKTKKVFPLIAYAASYPILNLYAIRSPFQSTITILFKQNLLPIIIGLLWMYLIRAIINTKTIINCNHRIN